MLVAVQRPPALHVSPSCCRNANCCHAKHLWRPRTSRSAQHHHGRLPSPCRTQAAAAAPVLAVAAAPDSWTVLAVLATCSAGAQWLEGHTNWGAALSSPLLALLGGAAAHGLGLLPAAGPLLDVVWAYVMPLAAGLFVLEHDVTRLVSEGAPLLASFLLGAAGMVLGAVVAWALVGRWMGAQGPALAACLTASYVGGTINFIATAQAVGLPAWCFPAAMAADNLAMAALLMVSLGLPLRGRDSSGTDSNTLQTTTGSPIENISSSSSRGNEYGTDSSQGSSALSHDTGSSTAADTSGRGPGWNTSPGGTSSRPALSRSSRVQGRPAGGPLATDGGALLTAVPSTVDVFAAITAAARGESTAGAAGSIVSIPTSTAAGSASSSDASSLVGAVAQQPTSVLDGPPIIPDGWWPLVPRHGSSSSSSGAAPPSSGATALSGDALLTAAPDPADLADAVAAARRGASSVQRRSLSSLSSLSSCDEGAEGASSTTTGTTAATTSSSSSMDGSSSSRSDRQQLWGRYGPAANQQVTYPSSPWPRQQVLREVGLLAPDGAPLLTEDPPEGALAAAVALARSGEATAICSVSSGASGSFDDQDQVADTPSNSDAASSRHSSSRSSSAGSSIGSTREYSSSRSQHVNTPRQSAGQASKAAGGDNAPPPQQVARLAAAPLTPQSAAASLAAACLSAAGARALCTALACPALFLMLLSLLAAGASWGAHAAQQAAWRRAQQQQQQQEGAGVASQSPVASPFAGSTALASALVGLFFAALGASCGALPDPAAAAPMLAFIAIMAGVHGCVMVGVGWGALRLEPRVLLLGSNANIGGPATAAGLAAARGWSRLVQPALLVGALGYALGTSAGLGVAGWTGALGSSVAVVAAGAA